MCTTLISIANNRYSAANTTDSQNSGKHVPSKQQGIKRRDLPADYLKCLEFSLGL